MRTARGIALAAAVATIAGCHVGGLPLGDDEARALLAGILDMANEAPLGTHDYACPLGGVATTTVTVATGQRGATAYTIGEWEIRLPWNPWCRGLAEGYPGLAVGADPGGGPEKEDVWFRYETAVLESGARRLRAVAVGGARGGWHDWETGESGDPCGFYHVPSGEEWGIGSLVFEGEKEAGDDRPFTGPLVGEYCEADVEIPLSDFPSTDRLLSPVQ